MISLVLSKVNFHYQYCFIGYQTCILLSTTCHSCFNGMFRISHSYDPNIEWGNVLTCTHNQDSLKSDQKGLLSTWTRNVALNKLCVSVLGQDKIIQHIKFVMWKKGPQESYSNFGINVEHFVNLNTIKKDNLPCHLTQNIILYCKLLLCMFMSDLLVSPPSFTFKLETFVHICYTNHQRWNKYWHGNCLQMAKGKE